MVNPMNSSDLFITGCDSNSMWQLEWFKEHFYKHNPSAQLYVYDFDNFANDLSGWFKKPRAMVDASFRANRVCWLDTDMQIQDNIEDIFNYVEPNKLAMVEDQPWTMRRKEKWHNSGLVAFAGKPIILSEWAEAIDKNPSVGDQEVLHQILSEGMKRHIHITDVPKNYNTLRLDLLDNTAPNNIKIMHWTGRKGKDEIWRMIHE